jgi:hypothetical protein
VWRRKRIFVGDTKGLFDLVLIFCSDDFEQVVVSGVFGGLMSSDFGLVFSVPGLVLFDDLGLVFSGVIGLLGLSV